MSRLRSRMLMMEPVADSGIAIVGEGTSLMGRWFVGNALTDLSGNGNTATLVAGATYDTDIPTVLFPATHSLLQATNGDRATVGNSASIYPTTDITLMGWIKRTTNNRFGIVGRPTTCWFGADTDGNNLHVIVNNSVVCWWDGILDTSSWMHLAITRSDANGWIIYKNGVAGGTTASTTPGANTGLTKIGNGNSDDKTLIGRAFDLRVYNVELSAAQLLLIAAGTG